MTALAWLIPVALVLGGLGLAAFLWALNSGQFDDLDGAAWRASGVGRQCGTVRRQRDHWQIVVNERLAAHMA